MGRGRNPFAERRATMGDVRYPPFAERRTVACVRVLDDQSPLFCTERASREWIDAGAVTKGWVSGILESTDEACIYVHQ